MIRASIRTPREWPMYALLALAGVLLVGGAYLLASTTIDRLIRKDAETTGTLWAADFAKRLDDLPAILSGQPPSPESIAFMVNASQLGNVFRFKLFDAQGRQRLVSDELAAGLGAAKGEQLGTHNPTAAKVLGSGQAYSAMKTGSTPDRPPVFVEAYVPVFSEGHLTAVTEVYVDQTEKLAVYRAHMTYATIGLVGLVALAFALPAAGFFWRTRQKSQADERISFLAHHDEMTGLANRSNFMAALDTAIDATRATRATLVVFYIDVDRFKDINDSLGHDVGDGLLRVVARRLRAITDPGDLVARIGGDEFAIVRESIRDTASAERFAQKLIATLAAPCQANGHDVTTTASIGIMLLDAQSTPTPDAVLALKRADIAMYRAKAQGRNRWCLFSPEMDVELQARRQLEQMIRRANADQSFELHFQPLYADRHGRPVGFEALLRLPDGRGGHIAPGAFIPVAEDMGLISSIGTWVLRRACQVASGWPDGVRVAVNLSPAQFADGSVVSAVEAALRQSGLAPHLLELEITEGLLLDETERVMRDLHALKALGASIVMDDFGTGYSSLSYLWKFPFDKIKIDRSFVSALSDADPSVGNIVRTIVALGQQLRLKVTAEGVETELQARFLHDAECDQLQGFLLGRPIPEAQVEPLLGALAASEGADRDARYHRREQPIPG
jgi:diguanylate cyclase (GGDEF)-like protein